jgi:hypothetical protein
VKHLILSKVLGGRFILTVICGVVFAYVAVRQIIPSEATVSIIVSVMTAYFGRQDRHKENGHEHPGNS